MEVFCLSLKRDGGSEVQTKLERTCHHYLDYTDLDNFHVASAINELGYILTKLSNNTN